MKENDWIVAGILNPEFNTDDFLISGLTPDNTQMLPEEQYKNSDFIRNKFTVNGVFNEQEFHDFYSKRAKEFGKLQSTDLNDTFIYSPFDTKAGINSTIQPLNYSIDIVPNSNRQIDLLGQIHNNNYFYGIYALRYYLLHIPSLVFLLFPHVMVYTYFLLAWNIVYVLLQ